MINKNSIVDGYMALSGSEITHIALLVVLLTVVHYPSDIDKDDRLGEICEQIFFLSAMTHGTAFIWVVIVMIYNPFVTSTSGQLLQII